MTSKMALILLFKNKENDKIPMSDMNKPNPDLLLFAVAVVLLAWVLYTNGKLDSISSSIYAQREVIIMSAINTKRSTVVIVCTNACSFTLNSVTDRAAEKTLSHHPY